MYHRIFIFALCVLCCFVGCKTGETRGTDFSAANREENIFIDGDDEDIMQSDQPEGSAPNTGEFSDDDDADSSGKGPDDEDAFDGSGSGSGPHESKPTVGPGIKLTPGPPTNAPKTSPPAETTTTPKSEPTKTPARPPPETGVSVHQNAVPEKPAKTTTTEQPRTPYVPNTEKNKTPNEAIGRKSEERPTSFFSQPGILAAVIGGAVVGLLCAILLVMFIVYRMRKKDEGSYALDEPKRSPRNTSSYQPPNKEFYA